MGVSAADSAVRCFSHVKTQPLQLGRADGSVLRLCLQSQGNLKLKKNNKQKSQLQINKDNKLIKLQINKNLS